MAKGAGIMEGIPMLILSVGGIILMLFFVTYSSQRHNLNSIKDKTVGNGQHGTARWATQQEIKRIYHHVPFTPEQWRQEAREGRQPTANGKALPQGIVLGSKGMKTTTALVDSDDVHVMMIGASGVGKTAYFLYPNLQYACASGMSFLALDTKGDLARNYGAIARDIYGYRISVVDLREPTRSDGNNLLTLINRYMDKHREDPKDIGAKAKAEKYAKILAKTIINPEGDGTDRGQNAYFIVMKTGTYPMKTKLKLFFDWGIQFQKPLEMPDRGSRPVYYAGKKDLERSILYQFPMIHMQMGATMSHGAQTAPKPISTTININTEDE